MKKLFALSILAITSIGLSGQTSLTYKNNGLAIGDSNTSQEIQYLEPGNIGAHQIWDFTNVIPTDKSPVSIILIPPVQRPAGIVNDNILLNDNGCDYFMNSSENQLEELGPLTSNLPTGVYFVRFTFNNQSVIRKVIKI